MSNTADITAGSKYTVNFSGINFAQGVRVLELYMNNTTNQIQGTAPFLYSKKDLIQFFVMMEVSGSLIEDTPGNWYFSSSSDLTTRAINYFMAIESNGNILRITADGVAPTINSSTSALNFVNPVASAAHPGFGLNFKVLIDGQAVFNGPMPNSVTDNNTFLTWLNTTYGSYGTWTKTYDAANYITNYVLNSKQNHLVSILFGTDAANLLKTNVGTAQTITFGALAGKTFGGSTYTLAAASSSGLPISYASSNTAILTVSGNVVTIVGAGTANITASQAGNGDYAAATPVVQAQVIAKANQTITFGAFGSHAHTDAPFALTATSSSALAVSYVSGTPSVASISGSTITPLTVGSTVVTASQAGNANYNAATPVNQTLTLS